MEYAHFALHLLPTLAVVVLALIIVRAVSIRVTWRQSTIRHLDGEASGQARGPRRLEVPAPGDGPDSRERAAASPMRSHAA